MNICLLLSDHWQCYINDKESYIGRYVYETDCNHWAPKTVSHACKGLLIVASHT